METILQLSDAMTFLGAAAVMDEAAGRSGAESNVANPIATTIAILIGGDKQRADELEEVAKARARRIFQNGEDWRRELELYKNFISRNFG
jgi:hypothetical protein